MAAKSKRDKLINAALKLAAKQRWDEVGLGDVAAKAKIPLAEAAAIFPSTHAIVAGLIADTDQAVLKSIDDIDIEDRALDRVFDIIMKRLDHMAPHKPALASMLHALGRAPFEQACLAGPVLRSQRLMLEAAGISTGGGRGMLKAKGLAIVYARTLRTWVKDDDPGMARTMARLDRELRRGERYLRALDGPIGFAGALYRFASSVRAARRGAGRGETGEASARD